MNDQLITIIGEAESGSINVIKQDDENYIVILDNFLGTLDIPESTTHLKFYLYGDSEVLSEVSIKKENKLDRIAILGNGSCKFNSLLATTVELSNLISCSYIEANTLIFSECDYSVDSENSTNIKVKGHTWFKDSKITGSLTGVFLHSPFVLIENSQMNISASTVFETGNEVSVEHCKKYTLEILGDGTEQLTCTACKLDETGMPIPYTQTVVEDEDTTYVSDRRKLFGYEPWKLATPFDKFKESTHYTDVNLHRHVNQEGDILPRGIDPNAITPEDVIRICKDQFDFTDVSNKEAILNQIVEFICNNPDYSVIDEEDSNPIDLETLQQILDKTYVWPKTNKYSLNEQESREYEAGIYGLDSYRTTNIQFHSEALNTDELP